MIHETAIIGPNVILEDGAFIGPFCVIQGKTRIGAGTRIEGHCSIGSSAEHHDYFETEGELEIGHDCIIREFVTINTGTTGETKVGDRVVLLRGAHVGHDSVIADDCTISCSALIGGHSQIMRGANLGLGAILHQNSLIGAYAMLGMGTVVTKSSCIRPGFIYKGNPARFMRENRVGLQRFKVDDLELSAVNDEFEFLKYGS